VRSRVTFVLALLAALGATRELRADSTDCREGTLVETGYTVDEVFRRCGSPSHRDTRDVHNLRNPSIVTHLEEWTYDRGPATFLRILRFYNGRLERIELRSREP
jgi:hypothetical protein